MAKSKPTAQSNPKADPKATAKSKPKAVKKGSDDGISGAWRRWRLALFLVLLICGGIAGGLVAYQNYTAKAEQQRQEAVQAAARSTAANVSREISRETQALAKLVWRRDWES